MRSGTQHGVALHAVARYGTNASAATGARFGTSGSVSRHRGGYPTPDPQPLMFLRLPQARASILRSSVVRQLLQHPRLLRMYQAKRSSTPCWISYVRSPTFHRFEDVAVECFIPEHDRQRVTRPSTPLRDDVSGEMLFHAMLDTRRPICNISCV